MKRIFTLSIISLLLASCGGEFSYKQGATPRDLAAAKNTCKGKGLEKQEDIALCLENNGWKVSQLDDLDLFAVITPTDNRNTEGNADGDNSAFVMVDKAATATESVPPAPTATSTAVTQIKTTAADKATPIEAKPTASKKIEKPAETQSAKDPLKIYKVSSWWKFGSTAAMLETQTKACVTKLGEAHKPNYATQEVTRGLVVCLYKKGWKALKAK